MVFLFPECAAASDAPGSTAPDRLPAHRGPARQGVQRTGAADGTPDESGVSSNAQPAGARSESPEAAKAPTARGVQRGAWSVERQASGAPRPALHAPRSAWGAE